MNIGQAVEALKAGKFVRRSGWNGKGMWLFLIPAEQWTFTNGKNDNLPLMPFVAMKTADDKQVPWLCSQSDLLAEDWEIC